MATDSQASQPGTLHVFPHNVSAFEPTKPLVRSLNINTILWLGGMGDTLGSVTYPFLIAEKLPVTWSLMVCALSSAGLAWGVKSLQTDVRDLDVIVKWVKEKRPGGKVVVMGHSTGCQDCMEYVLGGRGKVDGIILQAPVSDREALKHVLPEAFKKEADQLALKMCREGKENDAIPNKFTRSIFGATAISARRWVDISTPGGADDYFSDDLPLEQLRTTFGKIPKDTALCIVYSGAEESLPAGLDKEGLVKKWVDVVRDSGGVVEGSIVPGASHSLNGDVEATRQGLVKRVFEFIAKIDGNSQDTKVGGLLSKDG